MEDSEWTLAGKVKGKNTEAARRLLFGMKGGTPVSGDFNGDGVTDVGVFRDGQWFIDVNGNGVWDEGDLWAKLRLPRRQAGRRRLGRRRQGRHRHLRPGLGRRSAAHRPRAGFARFVEQALRHAKERAAAAKPGHDGQAGVEADLAGPTRADLIDHVFHYGTPRDVPLVGDWNGDGTDTIAVFRDGWWYLDVDGDGKWSDTGTTRSTSARSATCPSSATSTATASTNWPSSATARGISTPTATA